MAPLALSEITSEITLRHKGPRLIETPQKRPHFLDAALKTRKDLKIYNLTTANATLMIHQNYVPPTP